MSSLPWQLNSTPEAGHVSIPMCPCRPFLSTSPMRSWLVSAVADRLTSSVSGYSPIPAQLSISQAGRLAVKPVHGCMPSPILGDPSKPQSYSLAAQMDQRQQGPK